MELYFHAPVCFNDMVPEHIRQFLPLEIAGIFEYEVDTKDWELK